MPLTQSPIVVVAECGAKLSQGDRAYNYYDMKPGAIGEVGTDGWFHFLNDDGTRTLLNGQRICSMMFARLRGFRHTDCANCGAKSGEPCAHDGGCIDADRG